MDMFYIIIYHNGDRAKAPDPRLFSLFVVLYKLYMKFMGLD